MADQETAVSRDESFKSEEIKDDTSTKRRGREYFKRKVKDTFGHLKRLRYSKEKNKDKESPSENQPMLGRLIANARRDTEERDAEATQFEDSEGDSGEEFTTRMKGRLEQAHHQSEQVKAQMGTLIANAYSRVSVRAFIGEINTPGALRTQIIALREAEEKGVHDEEGGISAPEALAGRRVLQVVGRTLIANATNEGIRESDGDSALFYDVNLTSRFRTVGDMSRFTDPIKHDCDSLRSEIDDIVLTHSREKASEIRTRYEGILTDTFQDGSLPLALRQSFLEQTLEPQLEAAVVSGQIDRQRKDEIIAIVQGISDENSVERAALLSPFMPMYRRSDDAYIDSLDGFIRGEEYFGVQQLVSVACNNELAEIQQGIHKNFSRAARDTRHNEQDIIRIFSIDGIAMTPDMADDTIDIAEKFPGITQTTFRMGLIQMDSNKRVIFEKFG